MLFRPDEAFTASLFTGGGLWDIGAMMAGFTPVWGVEIRPDIAAVAERNIPGFYVVRADVATVDYSALPKVDHLHSSPSCKNASGANSGGEEAPEDIASALGTCRALRALKPHCFTLENVYYYRTFKSFRLLLACLSELGYHYDYWRLCSADYGVPQERYRLILIARPDRNPAKPMQTHYKPDAKKAVKGMRSMFWEPWRGWYSAVEDLIPTLPETQPAPWQLARMPAFTITVDSNQGGLKAFLVGDNYGNSNKDDQERILQLRSPDKPAMTVTAGDNKVLRAFIMPGGGNTNFAEAYPGRGVRYEGEPVMTVATVTSKGGARAFVGRWVSITPRCLARFQSVPDEYWLPDAVGLACEIIGNGVPSLLAQRICESLL